MRRIMVTILATSLVTMCLGVAGCGSGIEEGVPKDISKLPNGAAQRPDQDGTGVQEGGAWQGKRTPVRLERTSPRVRSPDRHAASHRRPGPLSGAISRAVMGLLT